MKNEFLLNAIGQSKAEYLLEAQQLRDGRKKPSQTRKKTVSWKILLAAALIPLLTITAYASDFLNIRALVSGAMHFSSSSYQSTEKAMKIAGFHVDLKEQFDNGYSFDKVSVQDTDALDENNRKVLTYREMDFTYRNRSGNLLCLFARPKLEEIPQTDHAAEQSRIFGDITASYYLDHYKFVPVDYQLTEADKLWEQQPGNFISYGSDEVQETNVSFLCWEKDGVCYTLMDPNARETPDTLFSMAAELITES